MFSNDCGRAGRHPFFDVDGILIFNHIFIPTVIFIFLVIPIAILIAIIILIVTETRITIRIRLR
jgi:hypothetical protein